MAKTKVFVSYDYDHDRGAKGRLISQAKLPDSPFSINDFSLQKALPNDTWISDAQRRIAKCDVFVVLLGPDTHSANGVIRETKIARGLHKRRFQLMPQGRTYGTLPGAGEVVTWKWKNLKSHLSRTS